MKECREISRESSKGDDEIKLEPDSESSLFLWKGWIRGYEPS